MEGMLFMYFLPGIVLAGCLSWTFTSRGDIWDRSPPVPWYDKLIILLAISVLWPLVLIVMLVQIIFTQFLFYTFQDKPKRKEKK